ncbi:hypothetical protein BaRGS_00000301, partial [Batillaria attramentaria]
DLPVDIAVIGCMEREPRKSSEDNTISDINEINTRAQFTSVFSRAPCEKPAINPTAIAEAPSSQWASSAARGEAPEGLRGRVSGWERLPRDPVVLAAAAVGVKGEEQNWRNRRSLVVVVAEIVRRQCDNVVLLSVLSIRRLRRHIVPSFRLGTSQ